MVILKRHQINDYLWNQCIENSNNPRIYALTWYLDSVCEEWLGITNAYYEFVFPIPIAKKWGIIPWVAQPPFCQQLGCFSKVPVDLKSLLQKILFYPKIHLNFHAYCSYPLVQWKKNSLLNLQFPYSILQKNYSHLRKRELKFVQKQGYLLTLNQNIEESLTFWFYEWQKKEFFQSSWKPILTKLVQNAVQHNRLYFLTAYKENQIIGTSLFLLDFYRIIYLGGTSIEKGVNTFMFDYIIQQFSQKVQYLDFEGSSIPSVQRFYESWGKLEYEFYGTFQKTIFNF